MTTLLVALLATTVMFDDPFKDKLAEGWTWVREDPAGWKIDATGLHIRSQSGTLWKDANNAKNVLVRQRTKDLTEFAIEVTVAAKPEAPGEQAGLIVYLDDDTYVKLVLESLEGKRWVVFGKEFGGKGDMVGRVPVEKDSVRLRLAVSQGNASGAILSEGAEPKEVGNASFALQPDMKVGVVSHGAPANAVRWATFSNFALTKP